LEFSNIGDFVIGTRNESFKSTNTFAVRLLGTHGATTVDFVFGVLMKIVVVGMLSIEETVNVLSDSFLSQSLDDRFSSVFATCHKHYSFQNINGWG
jgi:hypothetical protein